MRRKKKVLLAVLMAFTMMFSSLSGTLPVSVFAQDNILTETENVEQTEDTDTEKDVSVIEESSEETENTENTETVEKPETEETFTENEDNSTQEDVSASDEIMLLSEDTASIYVSSFGNDTNTGTKEAPYASLAKAIGNAQNGSTIYISDDLEITDTVTVNKNITIIGETATNGKKPVLKLSDSKKYSSIFKLQTDTTVTITGIEFSGKNIDSSKSNSSTGTAFYGGAIFIDDDNVNLTVNNCDFSDFEAHQGGAVCVLTADNVTVTLNNSVFTDNDADIGGGAVAGERCKNLILTISNCKFITNSAVDSRGGALFVNHSSGNETITVKNSLFDKNTASNQGGAVCIITTSSIMNNRKLNFTGNTFTENKATSSSYGSGGAVYADCVNQFIIEKCTFKQNTASKHGGAVQVVANDTGISNVSVSGSIFENNSAGGQGGAINLSNGRLATVMKKTLFQENETTYKMGNAIAYLGSSQATTHSYINPTDGAVFYNNGNSNDGIDRDTLYVQMSNSDDKVSICDYMMDGTKLNWKELQQDQTARDYKLVNLSPDQYHEISSKNLELYLDTDTSEPLSTDYKGYSNVFKGNKAQYGGAISNYGSLIIGTEGKDITVNKDWIGKEDTSATVNLVRNSDGKTIESVDLNQAGNWKYTFTSFPKNVDYKITENPISNYKSQITNQNDTWTITNTYVTYGDLRVSNTVTGTHGDKDKEFHFTVTLDDTTINGEYGDMTFTDGVAEITLKHGESATATGLPAGIKYTVTETEANADGYSTSATNDTGTIPENSNADVKFTNHKELASEEPDDNKPNDKPDTDDTTDNNNSDTDKNTDNPKTGDQTNIGLYTSLFAMSILGIAVLAVLKKKKALDSK